jgi:hypothetical protein
MKKHLDNLINFNVPLIKAPSMVYPNVANVGGLQSQGVGGDVVVLYFEPLTTQNLKSSGVPDVLGRSSKSEAQRVNNMAK